MAALLALEHALCCSNVTYRQPGDIYGNAVASAAAVYSVRASLSYMHCSHRGHMNNLEYYRNYLKRYIDTRNDMRYVRSHIHTYVRTHTARTDKFSIEHTSVGLAHARPIIMLYNTTR